MSGSPQGRSGETSRAGERRGIFGLETEYVILYLPEDPDDRSKPPFPLLQETLFSILLGERKAGLSGGIKRGYFLENGGLVHLEIYLRQQGDTPILEVATPECRSPGDLVLYARSFDFLLEEISRKSRARLAERGYRGAIAFGKSNRDSRGIGLGSHENYLVYLRPTRAQKVLYFLSLPVVFVFLIPAVVVLLLIVLIAIAGLLLVRLMPALGDLARHGYEKLKERERLWQNVVAVYHLGSNFLLLPGILLYTAVLRVTALRPFIRHLTSFLVTRQIFAGTGMLHFAAGTYEISQRAFLTTTLSNIIMFGRGKTIFDLKALLYEPLAFFRPWKKLAITLGDSNLADLPAFLRLSATAMVIEMIEAGEEFADLRLRRPVASFRAVSSQGPWKELELARGGRPTAIEIQRRYLSRARDYFGSRPDGRVAYRRTIELWDDVLQRMEDRLQGLADRVEWIAKKSLLDGAVLAKSDWKSFFAWGRFFQAAGLELAGAAAGFDDLLRCAPFRVRRRLLRERRRNHLDPRAFAAQRELHFQARKIDLRFHELSAAGGYERALEGEGLIERLLSDGEIERASREPPRDTRARIRGYYIRLSPQPEAIQASWHEVELLRPFRRIPLPDPFAHQLPGDG